MGAVTPGRNIFRVTPPLSPEVASVKGVSLHEYEKGSRLPPDKLLEPSQPVERQNQPTNCFAALNFLRGIRGGGAEVPNKSFGITSLGGWPHSAKAEVDRLEEALVSEARRFATKEDELEQMRKTLLKLEDFIQRQYETRQKEDRLSSIELTFAQQQHDTEEKVAKLVLAVAGEKRRADVAERSREEAERANEVTLKQLEASLEREQEACQQLRSRVGELEDCLELPQAIDSPILLPCPEVVGIGGDAYISSPGVHHESAAIKELQEQLHEGRAMRFRLEAKLLERDLQLRIPWKRDDSTNSTNISVSPHVVSRDLGQQPADCGSGSSDKDHILQELQHQLAEETVLVRDAQRRVTELGRQLNEVACATETKDLSRQQAMQIRLIKKNHEVCELQDQLAEELEKQRQMQDMMIQKDKFIFDLQQRVRHVSLKPQTFTLPAMPQQPVRGETEVDAAGGPVHIHAAPKSQQNSANCKGKGFGFPMPLGLRPPLASGPQLPGMQSSHSCGVVGPWQAGKLQRPSGAFRRGMYVQQLQQQEQGSSIIDGCSMSVRAATYCLPPGVSSHEVRRRLSLGSLLWSSSVW